jgi:hypothetical protein
MSTSNLAMDEETISGEAPMVEISKTQGTFLCVFVCEH